MSSMLEAVSTDTYGGLSGYKRPTQGNPTRVPGNLPAFRGATNQPGLSIRTPAIKSSANRHNRGTNVQLPYARETLVDPVADVGRLSNGDVAFVSKTRPGVPGYAHARYSRLLGVDALNTAMGPDYWNLTTETGKHRCLLLDSKNPADDWRSVPTLQEWTLDGIVLSNEASATFYNHSEGKRDNQLYNIAVQGPTAVNNGFVEEIHNWDKLARSHQGLMSQPPGFYPAGTKHRSEIFNDFLEVEKLDFAADYHGSNYHLYPLQMFSRDIGVLNELYVGLVCTQYKIEDTDQTLLDKYDELVNSYMELEAVRAGDVVSESLGQSIESLGQSGPGWMPGDVVKQAMLATSNEWMEAARNEMRKTRAMPQFMKAYRARSAFLKMGWWDAKKKKPKTEEGMPEESFCAFRYVLFSSAQALEMDDDSMMPEDKSMAMLDDNHVSKKRRGDGDVTPFDNFEQRKEDFKHMVGAWRIGKVMDMKAATMPGYAGGPVDTGYRVTVNVNVGWVDWRALRRMYTPVFMENGTEIGEAFNPRWNTYELGDLRLLRSVSEDEKIIFQWPTVYKDADDIDWNTEEADMATNKPYDPVERERRERRAAGEEPPEEPPEEQKPPPEYMKRMSEFVRAIGNPAIDASIRRGRLGQLVVVPVAHQTADIKAHVASLAAAITNLRILNSPVTEAEFHAHQAGSALPPIASLVMAPTSTPTSTPAVPASTGARRRGGNTPDPSPDRTGSVGAAASGVAGIVAAPSAQSAPSAPSAAAGSSLPAVIEAPSAPPVAQPGGQRKRRQPAAATDDVFSSIFGGDSSATMQPLNPAHRSDGGAGAGASGRSYQRRGKGGSGSKD